MPYPTPADRKDLEALVKSNWESKIATPYHDWDTPQLQSYLKYKGADAKTSTEKNKDSLVKQVKNYWTDSADTATNSYNSVKDWVFDGSSSIPISTNACTDISYLAGPMLNSNRSPTKTVFQFLNPASVIR